jgi:hypothetical protein
LVEAIWQAPCPSARSDMGNRLMSRGDIAVGALVGYVASRAMDAATGWYHPLQSEQSRRREEEIAPGGTLVGVGRQLGGALGRELNDAAAGRVGLALLVGLGDALVSRPVIEATSREAAVA